MIHLTTRLDPVTGMWQFLIKHKEKSYWSRPMGMKDLERIARGVYQNRLANGKGTANQFYLSEAYIIDLINHGSLTIQKVPPTAPALKRAASEKDRIAQELRWAKARTMTVDDLLEDLGL